jgi:hypothetical protein
MYLLGSCIAAGEDIPARSTNMYVEARSVTSDTAENRRLDERPGPERACEIPTCTIADKTIPDKNAEKVVAADAERMGSQIESGIGCSTAA